MNCSAARQQIFAERDGVLGDSQRAALAEHLAGCAACRQVRDGLVVAIETWRSEVRQVRVPDAAIEWQKLRRSMRSPSAQPRRSLTAWIAVPVAAAAAVAIGLYVVPHQPSAPIGTASNSAVATANAPVPALSPAPASTVVYVDDKSGWTFVWEPTGNGQRI